MKRKKPQGDELIIFCKEWDKSDRATKQRVVEFYGTTYGTACNWRSQASVVHPLPYVETPTDKYAKQTLIRSLSYLPPRSGATNAPLTLNTKGAVQTVAIINDTHNPYQDTTALALVETLLHEVQPDVLVYNGDVNDFYQISSFDKDPKRMGQMQQDVNTVKDMFNRHNVQLPNTRKILLGGNHEDRLQRFLWSKSPALSSLDCLTITELYGLKDKEIEYLPPECGLLVNGIFLIIHGTLCSMNSSYTAKRMFDRMGGSGIHGHTHRGGSYYKRNRFGIHGWYENFCLCDLNPDWVPHPDWQHGFSLVHFTSDHFWVEQLPIASSKLIYGGKIYE
uniref:Putative calcineurin-like phosphoesterase n=1 Tax=viral metagenome TaxID=1070528 RepID=A0A6M3L1M1_9ZZZZ